MKELLNQSFNGHINVPGDKSITHRSIMIGSLARGTTTVYEPLLSDDTLDTLKCMQQLGANIELNDGIITIQSEGYKSLHSPKAELYTGNSGTTTRLLMGLVTGLNIEATIVGDETIRKRPMDRVSKPLESMGANIELTDGVYPPIHIKKSTVVH